MVKNNYIYLSLMLFAVMFTSNANAETVAKEELEKVSSYQSAKEELSKHGLEFWGSYTAYGLQNFKGGLQMHNGGAALGLLDVSINWKHVENGYGFPLKGGDLTVQVMGFSKSSDFSPEKAGVWQTVNPWEYERFLQIYQVVYRQEFLDGNLWFKVGKFDPYYDVVVGESPWNFSAANFYFLSNSPLPTYNFTGLGVLVGGQPLGDDRLKLQALVMSNTRDDHSFGGFGEDEWRDRKGYTSLVEALYQPKIKENYYTGVRLGVWYSSDDCYSVKGQADDYGVYFGGEQDLYVSDRASVRMNALVHLSRQRSSDVPVAWTMGVVATGFIPCRPQDMVGFGISSSRIHSALENPDSYYMTEEINETIYEFFYTCNLTDHFSVQAVLQYVNHPATAYDAEVNNHSIVGGISVKASF